MKVISIKEPFASLIKDGYKKIETRSWKTSYRGEIYIHASLTKQKIDERIKHLNKMIDPKPGFILCKCNLVDCIYMDEIFIKEIKKNKLEYLCGHYEVGRYAWVLDNIEVIKPILVKGHLGIWNYEEGRIKK